MTIMQTAELLDVAATAAIKLGDHDGAQEMLAAGLEVAADARLGLARLEETIERLTRELEQQ